VTKDDALFRFRVRSLGLAQGTGNVRAACRAMGIHPSTYYRWRHDADRFGLDILRPLERRQPRMAHATTPMVEQRVLAWPPALAPSR
jgi:transposase-like protein